jgi:hypothetical protein
MPMVRYPRIHVKRMTGSRTSRPFPGGWSAILRVALLS